MADPNLPEQLQKNVSEVSEKLGLPEPLKNIRGALAAIMDTIFISAAVIFLLMLLFGGITYLLGAGNEETTARAKRMMLDSIVGLVITLASYAITVFVLKQFFGSRFLS